MPEATNGEKLVNSVILTLAARAAMIVAFPVVIWMASRAVNSFDSLSQKVDAIRDQNTATATTLQLIEQNQAAQSRTLLDHEQRVRLLEQMNRSILIKPQP